MLSVISAEALKLRRHRATWMLVWVYPIAVFVILSIAIIAAVANPSPPAPAAPELEKWLSGAADFWVATTTGLVRILLGAFVAVVFAGEYGWNTWKLIVPHRARSTLLVSKYVVTLGLLYIAFILAALIYMGMYVLEGVISGDPFPQGITFGALAQAHAQGFIASLPSVLLAVAIASLASIVTRSTTAALVISVVFVTLEQLFLGFAVPLSLMMPGVVEALYQLLPGYHVQNVISWLIEGIAQAVPFPSGEIAYGWAASLAILAAWIVGLVALTFLFFRRQDIN